MPGPAFISDNLNVFPGSMPALIPNLSNSNYFMPLRDEVHHPFWAWGGITAIPDLLQKARGRHHLGHYQPGPRRLVQNLRLDYHLGYPGSPSLNAKFITLEESSH